MKEKSSRNGRSRIPRFWALSHILDGPFWMDRFGQFEVGRRWRLSRLDATKMAAATADRTRFRHRPLDRLIVTDSYRFFGLSWETSTLKNYHPEDSKRSGSGRIEFSSKSTTFLM